MLKKVKKNSRDSWIKKAEYKEVKKYAEKNVRMEKDEKGRSERR